MSVTSEEKLWVICPICYKPSPAGTRFCEHCWGAFIHPGTPMTTEEVEEATREREAYLKRKQRIKAAIISFSILAALFTVYLWITAFTDLIVKPTEGLSSISLPGDWAMFRYDLARTGGEPTGIIPQGKQKWVFSAGGPINTSPAVAGGTVFFGSQDSKLYALNAETGSKRWEYETGSWVEGSPSVANGTVYFGSNDGRLYALNAQNGEKLWDFETSYPVRSAPAIAGGTLYFGSDDYNLYAIDAATAAPRWTFGTQSPAVSSPVVADGILYLGSANGYTYALNALNGQLRLRFRTHYAVYSAPAVKESTVYTVTNNGFVFAFDGKARSTWREHEIRAQWVQMWVMFPWLPKPPVQSGTLWSLTLPGRREVISSTSSPAVSGDILYLGAEKKLIAIDLQNHKKLWEFVTKGAVRSSPAVADGVVYVGSEDGRLYAIDAASGKKLWDFPTGGKITASPAVVNGVVYIGSDDGKFYAIE